MLKSIRWMLRRSAGLPVAQPSGAAIDPPTPPRFAPDAVADVVISYSSRDRAIAEPLISYLREKGIHVWWDAELYPGEDLHDAIAAALDSAKAVIVIWSDAAAGSMWVRDEARRAAKKNKLITTHVPRFDLEKIPLGFGERRCDDVEDRTQLIRALSRFGIVPQARLASQPPGAAA